MADENVHVLLCTTTTTQSRGTTSCLSNSLNQVMTTASHGASPGDHPRPSFLAPSVVSPPSMVTTCSVTLHSSTPLDVSSPSAGHNPLPAAANNCVSSPSSQPPPAVVLAQENVVDAVTSSIRELVSEMKPSSAHDVSHCSEASDHNLAANRQLALAQIKADTRAERFDGKDAASYRSWGRELEDEVWKLELPLSSGYRCSNSEL